MFNMANICVLTDENGNVVARREYNAFGEVISQTGEWNCRFGFHTNWIELKDGLYLTPTRIYDSKTGRFIQRDPMLKQVNRDDLGIYRNSSFKSMLPVANKFDLLSKNEYVFAGNSPTNNRDSLGLENEAVKKDKKGSNEKESDCEKQLTKAKQIMDNYRKKKPPIKRWRDCYDGSSALSNLLVQDSGVTKYFTIIVYRKGRAKGPVKRGKNFYHSLGWFVKSLFTDDCPCYQYIELHTVVFLKPKKGNCREMVLDYLFGKMYSKFTFDKAYPLDVDYKDPGYYEIDCNGGEPKKKKIL